MVSIQSTSRLLETWSRSLLPPAATLAGSAGGGGVCREAPLTSLILAAGRGVAGAGEARVLGDACVDRRRELLGSEAGGPGGLGGESARYGLLLRAAPGVPAAAALLREPLLTWSCQQLPAAP